MTRCEGSIKGTVLGDDGSPAADVRVEARQSAILAAATAQQAGGWHVRTRGLRGPCSISVNSEQGIAKQPPFRRGKRHAASHTPGVPQRPSWTAQAIPFRAVPFASPIWMTPTKCRLSSRLCKAFSARNPADKAPTRTARSNSPSAPGSYIVNEQRVARHRNGPLSVAAGETSPACKSRSPGVTISGTVVGPNGELRGATVQLGPITQDTAANLVSAFVPADVLKTAGATTTNEKASSRSTKSRRAPTGSSRRTTATRRALTRISTSAGRDITAYRIVLGNGGEARHIYDRRQAATLRNDRNVGRGRRRTRANRQPGALRRQRTHFGPAYDRRIRSLAHRVGRRGNTILPAGGRHHRRRRRRHLPRRNRRRESYRHPRRRRSGNAHTCRIAQTRRQLTLGPRPHNHREPTRIAAIAREPNQGRARRRVIKG